MNRIPSPNPHGAANVKDIEKFEEFIGEKLPNDIRKYFEKYNGGKWTKNIFLISSEDGKSSLHHVYGFFNSPDYKSMYSNYDSLKFRIGPEFVPFADDPGGNQICISVNKDTYGYIYYWEHELEGSNNSLVLISKSFNSFVNSLEGESFSTLDSLLNADDVDGLKRYIKLDSFDIHKLDEYERNLLERAVITASVDIIKYLVSKNVDLRSSIMLAKRNAQFFSKHEKVVKLLEDIDSE